MSDGTAKPDGKRRRWLSAVPYAILAPLIYMGAYYATVENDGLPYRTYAVWNRMLPEFVQDLFAPADWIDDWIRLAPCKRLKNP